MRTSMLFALVALSSCTLDMSEPTTSQVDQKVESLNRLATNRLATNRLATNRLATNRLATNSLSTLVALEETSEILADEEGRDVYSYIVGCALPEGTVIHAEIPGANDSNGGEVCTDASDPSTCVFIGNYECIDGHCRFFGAIGLTPEWLDRRINTRGKGWISACMFARVNKNQTATGLSMRGHHEALGVTVAERETFSIEEGAFFGDLFIDDPDPETLPDWFACSGKGIYDGVSGGLDGRDCAKPDPANPAYTECGFNYAGPCRNFNTDFPTAYSCRTFDGAAGVYGDCHEEPGHGKWAGKNRKFRQVITTYVSE
jgi:hypothetical protein